MRLAVREPFFRTGTLRTFVLMRYGALTYAGTRRDRSNPPLGSGVAPSGAGLDLTPIGLD